MVGCIRRQVRLSARTCLVDGLINLSTGMLMGFVSYASIVSPETLQQTIQEVRANSHAKTDFEKAQEEVSQTQPATTLLPTLPLTHTPHRQSYPNSPTQPSPTSKPSASPPPSTSPPAPTKPNSSLNPQQENAASPSSSASNTPYPEAVSTSNPLTQQPSPASTQATSGIPSTLKSWLLGLTGCVR